jgi:tetratricopeptide (TPR) repeat protein/tRNA A-37 threonylcarbamoyl transferase component Bud32
VQACPDDNALVAMADHGLDAAVEVHIDECEHCRRVVAAAIAAKSLAVGTPPPGDDLPSLDVDVSDRYIISAVLGRGGMGTVYLAQDRTLGRAVALKLHHRAGAERLHREAMAMAKLAHPNVVTVFEVATVDDRLYVAMEYVRGETFRGWFATETRGWRDIIAMLCGAGEGLVAAHAAGLIHRDFKPENILVGDDGRPRVGDFGLARIGPAPAADAINVALADTALTQAGSVLGTPAYMAPEQLAGDTVDERCDQFAFCIVAWEALYGERPFTGIDRTERKEPRRSAVPVRVRRVLERGLALDPAARYSDMRGLLAALRTASRSRTKTRVAVALAGAAILVGGGYAAITSMQQQRHAEACLAEGEAVRGLVGQPTQLSLRMQFLATGSPLATDAFGHAMSVLAPYADTLAAQTTRACNATSEPAELRAARKSCLESHTRELAAFTEALAHPDAEAVYHAPGAAWSMSEVLPCSDPSALMAHARRRASTVQGDLDHIKALNQLGHYRKALTEANALLDKTRKAGDREGELSALIVAGQAQVELENSAAKGAFEQATALAESLGHDAEAADAYASLASIAGTIDRDYALAQRYLGLSRAKLERIGGKNLMIRGDLFTTEASIASDNFQFDKAEVAARQAVATLEQAVGPSHPRVGAAVEILSQILFGEHKTEEAMQLARRGLAILSQSYGLDHPTTAGAEMNLSFGLIEAKKYDDARALLLHADSVFARVYGDVHPVRAAIAGNLGDIEQLQDHWTAALGHYRRAVALLEQTVGPDSEDVSGARRDVAKVLGLADRTREAIEEQQRAIAILVKAGPNGESRLVGALVELAEMQLELENKTAAKQSLDRALALSKALPADAEELARARELLTYTR